MQLRVEVRNDAMGMEVTGALDSAARTITRRLKIRARNALVLVVGAVIVAGWLAWRRSSATAAWRAFDGTRAFGDLQNVTRLGPRPPGSAAHDEARQFISTELTADGIEVWHDNFIAATPAGDIAMTN